LLLAFAGNLVQPNFGLGYLPSCIKRRDYVFTFLLVASAVFLLCNLLVEVEIDLAFALGLFAIFGIIRYRTDAIPIREMTYLFIVIALAVLNALAPQSNGIVMLIASAANVPWFGS
jgi:thiol:disulfide interchange protein